MSKDLTKSRGTCITCGGPIPYYSACGSVSDNKYFCKRSCRKLNGANNPFYKDRNYEIVHCNKCGSEIERQHLQPARAATRKRCENCRYGHVKTGQTIYKYKHGYVGVRVDGKLRGEHCVIAEKALGRPLQKGEVVHHIDGDGTNNDPSNLLICTIGYHRQLHAKMGMLYAKEHFGKGNWEPSVEVMAC